MRNPHFILASRSPRRQQLLTDAGYQFRVIPASDAAEDTIRESEQPGDYVLRLAFQKAEDVVKRLDADAGRDAVVIACDTLVVAGNQILGKPKDKQDAARILKQLRGTVHEVLSGLCVWNVADQVYLTESDKTVMMMDPITDEQLESYLETGQWAGKAGAFGYQDGYDWLHIVQGSESNVVGLPMELLTRLIEQIIVHNHRFA